MFFSILNKASIDVKLTTTGNNLFIFENFFFFKQVVILSL